MRVMKEEIENTCHAQSSILTTGQSSVTSSKNVSVDIKQNQSMADDSSVMTIDTCNIEVKQDNLNANSNCDSKVSTKKNNCVHEENWNKGVIDLKSNTSICTTSKDVTITIEVNTQLQMSWEIRAFYTTIIIAFQTVVLTAPFVASYLIEVLSSTPLTLQIRVILFFPFLINSISNPFIYAWRIPEIREEFRRLFRINTYSS
ncbi:unnamed protein product [Mytilus coruscus]|uniref:G-protein coupled receptors family 1 profile domain-containing protein n=1 Tax=Mytilus coruscus TaxID=42192 RepID=A0A6J8CNB0_MYTCO|nr:unnamed protein product [Mytilus coruscus]